MSEIETKISSKGDAKKNYEAVQMLNTDNDDDKIDQEKGPNKNSEDQITLRRVFLENFENYKAYCSKTTFSHSDQKL